MSDNETARLIYLVLLLLFVGGFLWSSGRLALKRHLKMLLAWIGIFILLILFYSQLDTFMAQLDPGRGQVLGDGKTIAIARSASGSFEAVVSVNGKNIRFLVDTGASDVVLSRRDAERVGIDPDTLLYLGRASTANGMVDIASVTLEEVSFGGYTDRNVDASVTAGALNFSLLGMSYLNRFERIEISGDEMRLVR